MKRVYVIVFNSLKTLAVRPNASDAELADRSFWAVNFITLFPLILFYSLFKSITSDFDTSVLTIIWLMIIIINYFILMYDAKWIGILKQHPIPPMSKFLIAVGIIIMSLAAILIVLFPVH